MRKKLENMQSNHILEITLGANVHPNPMADINGNFFLRHHHQMQ